MNTSSKHTANKEDASAHVVHNIEPIFDTNSQVLLLGTMPSPKSREQGFFYGHPQNRFWKVLAALFDEPTPETTEEKKDLCLRHHIALWDVLASCDIKGASDASITNVRPNDLSRILSTAPIKAIFTTGIKAGQLYRKLCEPSVGIPCTVLPSTSPANSRVRLPELCAVYHQALAPFVDFEPTYPILDVPKVVSLEQAIATNGTSLYTLMHRAGKLLAYETKKYLDRAFAGNKPECDSTKRKECNHYKTKDAKSELSEVKTDPDQIHISILCGHGNNGGDGWVAADYLVKAGYHVDLISSLSAQEIKAEPAHTTACEIEQRFTVPYNSSSRKNKSAKSKQSVRLLINPTDEEVEVSLSQADVIIDALLGTGFSGDTVREPFATWIELANQQKARDAEHRTQQKVRDVEHHAPSTRNAYIIAADVPSGFSAQTGNVATPCIQADHTVTMIAMKTGLIQPSAKTYCGTIRIAPLEDISPYL